MQINRVNSYPPNFNARYQIDTSSAESRSQVFTLGMLMSNFWIDNARYTFTRIRNTNVFDTVEITTKDDRNHIIETILKNANIKYKRLGDF